MTITSRSYKYPERLQRKRLYQSTPKNYNSMPVSFKTLEAF